MSVVISSYRFHCIKTELNYDYPNDYKILKGYHLFLVPAWVSPGYFQIIKYSSGPLCHFLYNSFVTSGAPGQKWALCYHFLCANAETDSPLEMVCTGILEKVRSVLGAEKAV